jgi:phytanoyl-CoA hydroxylase
MAAWVAVDDADAGNGGMMCVPQTARLEVACPEKADPALFFTTEHVEPPPGLAPEMMELKAGDVLFFNGSVIHGSTPNTSADRFPPFADLPLRAGEHGGDEPLLRGVEL